MFSIIIGFLCFYFAAVLTMYVGQRNMMYYPNPNPQNKAQFKAEDMSELQIQTEDGILLSAWYKEPEQNKPIIVVFHGNASHMGMSAWKVREYMDLGYGALLPAYRGYAGNKGKPSEQGFYKDAKAVISWLLNKERYTHKDIILLGESLGSGIAIEMASNAYPDIKAVILESPYTSFPDLAKKHYPFIPFAGMLVKDKYNSIAKIDKVSAPVLIIHGQKDLIVPYEFGERLYEAASEPKEMITMPLAGHNDLYLHGASDQVVAFLSQL